MLTLSIYISKFISLSNFSEKLKFDSIHTQNIYNKIIIKIIGYFWSITLFTPFGLQMNKLEEEEREKKIDQLEHFEILAFIKISKVFILARFGFYTL